MSSKDIFDRPYAKLSELKAGDLVEVDDGFTCMEPNEVLRVHEDTLTGLQSEKHFLDGQLFDEVDDYLVGVYPDWPLIMVLSGVRVPPGVPKEGR